LATTTISTCGLMFYLLLIFLKNFEVLAYQTSSLIQLITLRDQVCVGTPYWSKLNKIGAADWQQYVSLLWTRHKRWDSCCSKRYAKANNELVEDYDKTKEKSYIVYLDACNLYGHAMGENKLPTSGFKWLTEEDIKAKFNPVENILSLDDEAEIGIIWSRHSRSTTSPARFPCWLSPGSYLRDDTTGMAQYISTGARR